MTTAYTSLLGLALPVQGELQGTWGDTVNTQITQLLDSAVAGTATLSTDGDVTLSTTTGAANQARQAILLCSGARTAQRTITAPAQSKIYTVINATTGGYAVKIVGAGPTTGVTILAGESAQIAWNGSDFVKVSNTGGAGSFTDLTVSGSLTLSGGTANGVAYLNGSKVLTTGSALTFDGSTLGLNNRLNFSAEQTSWAAYSIGRSGSAVQIQGGTNGFVVRNSGDTFNTYQVTDAGVAIWKDVSSELMRLTSTGLGIGTSSPATKLHISGSTTPNLRFEQTNSSVVHQFQAASGNFFLNIDATNATGGSNFFIQQAGTTVATLSASGNIGLGVTPSAWDSVVRPVLSIKAGTGSFSFGSTGEDNARWMSNAYYSSGFKRVAAGYATQYEHNAGAHIWYNAASGAANSAISFTQAMTLDASGNLGVGTTSPSYKFDVRGNSAVFAPGTSANTSASLSLIANNSGGTPYCVTSINAVSEGSTWTSALAFYTRNSSAVDVERARITSSGTFLVGVTSAFSAYGIAQFGSGIATTTGSSSGGYINGVTTGGTEQAYLSLGANYNLGSAGQVALATNGSYDLLFGTNNAERARITSGGQLLVGNTTTSGGEIARFQTASGATSIGIIAATNGSSYVNFGDTADANVGFIGYDHTNNYMNFRTNGAEAMRIDSGGYLLVGKTTTSILTVGMAIGGGADVGYLSLSRSGSTNTDNTLQVYSTGASANRFYVGMGGTVYATSTTITAISDQRLKENIQDLDVGLDAVMALKPRKFDWKPGKGKDKKGDRGWIAQEFEQVFPDLIDEWKDPAPEGEEPYKAVNADLIPVLVKAIQEQQTIIESLKARLDAANI